MRWVTQAGGRGRALVAPDGSVRFGARARGKRIDVPAPDVRLPLARALRRTPDGALWALQTWRRLKDGPAELRFSRWRGEPTRLTLEAVCCRWRSETIQGQASFQGKPVYGADATPAGVPLDPFGRNVYLDSRGAGGWTRMMGILTRSPTGFYSLHIRPHWRGGAYRGTIIGPNAGWTLAPDARAETASSL